MTKSNYKPPTPIDQGKIIPFPTKPEQRQNTLNLDQLKEDITFLAGTLRCTINLEDKSKVPGALELCIDLLRSIFQQVEEVHEEIISMGVTHA